MNKKTKNFSDLSKKQKDKIISDSCEGANEEQAKLLLELTEKEKEKENDKEQAKQAESYLSLVKEMIRLKYGNDSKEQKDKIISECCKGANEEQTELLEESKRIKIVNWITDNLTYKNEFGNIELSLSLKQLELLLGFISKLLEEEKKDKEISRLKHKDDDEPTKADYYAKGYRDGIKETLNTIIEVLKEQYKQIK